MNEQTRYEIMKNRELLKGYQISDVGAEATDQEQKLLPVSSMKKKTGKREILLPSDFENPKVLGVDVKCGTPVLDIKNILREYGIFNSEISSFTNDCKYIMDLKTICTGDVVCDRIEFLYNSFKSFYFDYIVIGKCINEYHFPEKVVRDAYALLKRDGQMFLSLKNTYNVLTLL